MSTSTKKTSADAFTGTSAVQHAQPDAALLHKNHQTAKVGANAADAPALDAISNTNVSSIFWSMQSLRTHGSAAWNFPIPPGRVLWNSQVSVTMTELDNNGTPFLGAASMQVFNVVPMQDSITVWYNVNWGSDLNVMFNFIIVN